jgi:putative ABC transport system permease protein
VFKVFGLENSILGGLSGLLAMVISQAASWIIITKVFDITFKPIIGSGFIMIAVATLFVTISGLLPSWTTLRKRPVAFLREQTNE